MEQWNVLHRVRKVQAAKLVAESPNPCEDVKCGGRVGCKAVMTHRRRKVDKGSNGTSRSYNGLTRLHVIDLSRCSGETLYTSIYDHRR